MKRVFSILLQFLLFFLVFAAGSFARPFRLQTTLDGATSAAVSRFFIWDGLLLMLAIYFILLLIQAARKRFSTAAPWTTLALVLAGGLGLALRLGFITHDRF
ncbi:MAG: hypothetical protein KGK08_01565 [Acidobacteriota bacterium]|nr:hypothetical protein [Acidobacteriota bacterium]